MKAALALFLAPALGAATEPPAAGGVPSAFAARKQLEAARRNLGQAIQRTGGPSPSGADLDAAAAAIEALKGAIADGAGLEATHPDYAKSALAARKELTTRGVDFAVAKLNANAQHPRGRVLTAGDLKPAEAALATLKQELVEARPLGKRDANYALFLARIDTVVARHEQAFDENWTRLLRESRQALTTAMAAFAAEANAAHVEAGDAAATQLSRLLEETARAEARNAAYRTDADRARVECAQAMKVLRPDAGPLARGPDAGR